MRILQIIDSLESGGAERMAVNYANALVSRSDFSGLAVTRKEGGLKQSLSDKAGYVFLGRKSTFDFGAILRLRAFCKKNRIGFLHAHSTSWFLAVCVKLTMPSVKIIWHDHYGLSEFAEKRKDKALRLGSYLFSGIISVNEKLKSWAKSELKCSNVVYLPNFAQPTPETASTELQGQAGKRILCLANLREQKDHFMLVEAALKMRSHDWTFHLVGKDFEDAYAADLRKLISDKGLSDRIFIYGSRLDINHIISQSDIAILTSKSEGLPVALLEYGFASKPVVVTAVGEIPTIVESGKNGILCVPSDAESFAKALDELTGNEAMRKAFGEQLYDTVSSQHSENAVMEKYLGWLGQML
ncbi:glycosyltransferase [Flavobacterium sp. MAH-1]|uniref:Glycosyltransferase n=1 Tax=Flavobacterium agri TaxID=2743471 RepID=A0A7Y8Y1K1_9FLAO|nr:glycosyltransferase [Flavobacterium agri]NUY80905.1 glycosyltransferase [Flavobacterium agri]NYA70929.1 glycosyltransferase [Flavobacterium agri]